MYPLHCSRAALVDGGLVINILVLPFSTSTFQLFYTIPQGGMTKIYVIIHSMSHSKCIGLYHVIFVVLTQWLG